MPDAATPPRISNCHELYQITKASRFSCSAWMPVCVQTSSSRNSVGSFRVSFCFLRCSFLCPASARALRLDGNLLLHTTMWSPTICSRCPDNNGSALKAAPVSGKSGDLGRLRRLFFVFRLCRGIYCRRLRCLCFDFLLCRGICCLRLLRRGG